MTPTTKRTTTALAVAALTVAAAGLAAPSVQAATTTAACTYKSAFLPLPAGATGGQAVHSGAKDVFGGTITVAGDSRAHAAVWKDGTVTDLGTVPGTNTGPSVNDVNSSGVAVGSAYNITGEVDGWPTGYYVAFRSRDGALEPLPQPEGHGGVIPTGISDNGDVYGSGFTKDPNHRTVYIWPADRPGTVVEAPGFPAGSEVEDVDSDGTVAVTVSSDVDGTWRPYTWKNGVAKALPLPAGAPNASVSSISNGRVVGHGLTSSFATFGVLWDGGTAKKLTGSTDAYDISPTGLVLGSGRSNTLWQLTTPKGNVSGAGYLSALTDDNALIGHAPRPNEPNSIHPAIWRCI